MRLILYDRDLKESSKTKDPDQMGLSDFMEYVNTPAKFATKVVFKRNGKKTVLKNRERPI